MYITAVFVALYAYSPSVVGSRSPTSKTFSLLNRNPRRNPVAPRAFQGWSLSELGVNALTAWLDKCRAKESVAGTVKDPAIWAELYKKFLGANYFTRAGVAKP